MIFYGCRNPECSNEIGYSKSDKGREYRNRDAVQEYFEDIAYMPENEKCPVCGYFLEEISIDVNEKKKVVANNISNNSFDSGSNVSVATNTDSSSIMSIRRSGVPSNDDSDNGSAQDKSDEHIEVSNDTENGDKNVLKDNDRSSKRIRVLKTSSNSIQPAFESNSDSSIELIVDNCFKKHDVIGMKEIKSNLNSLYHVLNNENMKELQGNKPQEDITIKGKHFLICGNYGHDKLTEVLCDLFNDLSIRTEEPEMVKMDEFSEKLQSGKKEDLDNFLNGFQNKVIYFDELLDELFKGNDGKLVDNYPLVKTLKKILKAYSGVTTFIFSCTTSCEDKICPQLEDEMSFVEKLEINNYSSDEIVDIIVAEFKEKLGLDFSSEAHAKLYTIVNKAHFDEDRTIRKFIDSLIDKVGKRQGDRISQYDKSGITSAINRLTVEVSDLGDDSIKITLEDIYKEIDSYIGLDFIKDIFEEAYDEIIDKKEQLLRGVEKEDYPDHFIFAGNPGTGKTTVGKLLGKFYHAMGVLEGAETSYCDASELLPGKLVGASRDETVKKFKKAIEKKQLLFIDEAYQITESQEGKEIAAAIMSLMTENASDFKVVFAMYSNKVEDFLNTNVGMKSRVKVVQFPDYTPEQLIQIFDGVIDKLKTTIDSDTRDKVYKILSHEYSTRSDDFGNARRVKDLVKEMDKLRKRRVRENNILGEARYVYTEDDIPSEYLKLLAEQSDYTIETIMEELDTYIGLDAVKKEIEEKKSKVLYAKKYNEPMDDIYPGYYFFMGNAGTGKTTSARLFAKCLYKLGILKTDKFTTCSAKDLIGEYKGQTSGKTYEVLKKSINATLFIDEAYALAPGQVSDGESYISQALNEIVGFLDVEEHRRNCCIIFAGYEKDMRQIFSGNQGLQSRVDEVMFSNYSPEETYQIFEKVCADKGYKLSKGVKEEYYPLFVKLVDLKSFSNGRSARTIAEKTISRLQIRCIKETDNDIDHKLITTKDLMNFDEINKAIGKENG